MCKLPNLIEVCHYFNKTKIILSKQLEEITIINNGIFDRNKIITYIIHTGSEWPEENHTVGINNIRFKHQNIIESIELEYAGTILGKIYNKCNEFQILRNLYKIKNKEVIPFPYFQKNKFLQKNPIIPYSEIKIYIKTINYNQEEEYKLKLEEPNIICDLYEINYSDVLNYKQKHHQKN